MAKKQNKNKFDDDSVSNDICAKYGDIVESGNKVLDELQNLKVISVSPALDIALGGGFREGSCVVMTGDPKSGKAQPLSSTVYTPSGPVKMGDLNVGDEVLTPDGGRAKILNIFPQGDRDVYKVTFSDGVSVECDLEHLWKVSRNQKKYEDFSVLTLKQILESGLKYSDRPKWKIQRVNKCDFNKRELLIDPYILGCLIGDGGFSQGSVIITSADKEIVQKFSDYAATLSLEIKPVTQDSDNIGYRISRGNANNNENQLIDRLRLLGLMGLTSHEKFIPQQYLYSSYEDRLQLARGLMDTDGYNSKGVLAEYSTVSKQLSKDVAELMRSLGFIVVVKPRKTKCNGKEFPSYRLHIKGIDISSIFSLYRKRYDRARTKGGLFRTIKSVSYVGTLPCQCIYIDHPDHLYITDNFTVTHNTTTALSFAAKCQALGKNVIYFNTEGRLTKENFLGIKGLDPSKIKIIQSTESSPLVSAETYLNVLESYVKNTPDLVAIVDSASSMVPQEELEGDVRTGVRNSLPRLLAMFFKRIGGDVHRSKAILIFITHNIANTGGSRFAPTKMADCGNMLQYQAGTNIVITHRGKWEYPAESGNHIGQIANWVVKTSAAGGKPNSTAASWIRYGIGIDEAQEIAQIATELNFIKKAGAWFTLSILIDNMSDKRVKDFITSKGWGDLNSEDLEKQFKFQGSQNVTDFISENQFVQDFLYEKVKEAMGL